MSFLIAYPQGRWQVNLGPDSDLGPCEPGVSEQMVKPEDDVQALGEALRGRRGVWAVSLH